MNVTNKKQGNIPAGRHILNPATGKPVTNAALNQATKALRAENNAHNLNAVLNELTRTVLLSPARVELPKEAIKLDANGRVQVPKDTKITFALLKAADGKSYFPAFSCEAELRKWKQNPAGQVMVLRFDDYARMLRQNEHVSGFVLDPFGDNLRFDAKMVASVKEKHDAALLRAKAGLRQAQIKPGDRVTIVEPSAYPDALLDPLCKALAECETVAAAYLQVMLVNDTNRYYLLVLDAPRSEQNLLKVGEAVRPFMTGPDKKMDLNITTSDTPLGQQGMRDSEPFYVRGKGRVDDLDEDDASAT